MVDKIDKALPNVKEKVYVESPEEIQIEETEKLKEVNDQGVEIIKNEDGSAEIEFEPGKVAAKGGEDHFSNLADLLPDDVTGRLAADLYQNYEDYKNSRKDWEQSYITGLDLLGFKYVNRSQPFQGASGATHPVLAEAVTQFQATAYKELLPADGPVRTQILGVATREKEDQAARVKEYMNYQIMNEMPEYDAEFDQLLFYLPLAGSAFKKVYYDEMIGRAVSKFVQADDLIVPYSATSLEDAEAIFQRMYMSENDIRKSQVSGFYSDVELGQPNFTQDKVHEEERKLEGTQKSYSAQATDTTYTVLEAHVNLDLEGFEDTGEDGEPTGIKLPYIVTLEAGSRKILSVRRNYQPNDPLKKKVQYFVHFKFLPGLGFYGFGLIHMIGGLSRTATVALRQLLDAGTLSNLPAGFKMRGIRVRDDAQPLQPGEFRDVDAPGGNLKDAFYPLPYKEPSQTLLQLMGVVVQAGQRFASIADMQVGEGNQQAAVGTTVALLERGSRVMSAIHKRLYNGLKQEFKLLANIFSQYLPAEYPYDVVGGQRMIKQMDFDERVDIVPVADPNIFSMTQRITLAQTELQLAMSNPQMHNLYMSYRKMYEALGLKNIDQLLPPPPPPQPKDPAMEHIDAMAQKPFQAYRNQDHRAHITAHMNFMATNFARNNPPIMAALEKNVMEHISLMAQEHVEMEFAEQIKQMQQAQQQGMQGQQAQQQMQQLNTQMEARKAVLIAEYTEEFMKQEKEITSMLDSDPLIKLKSQELDLKAMENFRKQKETTEKINIDKSKLLQNRDLTEQKLEQNEELAELRAETSLEKQAMANRAKMRSDMIKRKDVKTLKGS